MVNKSNNNKVKELIRKEKGREIETMVSQRFCSNSAFRFKLTLLLFILPISDASSAAEVFFFYPSLGFLFLSANNPFSPLILQICKTLFPSS